MLPRALAPVCATTSAAIAWRWHAHACAMAQAAALPVCTTPARPSAGSFHAGSRRPLRRSPALHRGLLRRGPDDKAVPVSILVDSGSQQAPLCSERVAQYMGGKGSLVSFATQAGGQPLPIYDVGWCQLGVNGASTPTCFQTAPIAPYDVILGEDWMHENRIVLDYADSLMLQKSAEGQLMPFSFDNMLPPGSMPAGASLSPLVVPPPVCAGSRTRRCERRHGCSPYDRSLLHAVLDVDKELPEDEALDLGDIPGVSPAERTAFSFIEDDVRIHLDHLPTSLVEEVVDRLRVFEEDVFETRSMPRLAPARDFDVEIVEKPGSQPPARRPYPVALHHRAELDRQVQVLLDAGIVRRSFSPYAAPVLFSPKKDGKLRLCIDYRGLNLQTVRDRFPTPTAADLIAKTRGAQWFSKIDLHSGFHQLRIREQDVHKTAFSTPSGLFEFVTAPFGLTNVPGCFQRFMQHVLAEHIEKGYCVVYCDDVAIFSNDADPLVHLQHVEAVLASLRQHQLLAKGSKCELMRREAEFLGFMVSGQGVRPLPSKVEAVLQVPAPETVSHLRSFLGLCNFFRSHLPAFAEVSSPLTDLLKGSKHGRQRLQWNLACEHAFVQLKTMLTSAPLLRHFDPTLRTAVHVDASQNAVGAVLLQWEEGDADPRPVCFLSRKFQGAQYRYDARNAESLAAQIALAAWRPYLSGIRFELVSDHASLQSLFQQKAPSHRILRFCEFLADFDFEEVKFVRGSENIVPDFLSRPWDALSVDLSLHVLSHPRAARPSALCSAARLRRPQVLLLPVHAQQLAVCQSGDLFRIPSALSLPTESTAATARRLALSLGLPPTCSPVCAGQVQGVSLWQVHLPAQMPPPPLLSSDVAWHPVDALQLRSSWLLAHFEALRVCGVLPSAAECPGVTVPSLMHLATSAPSSSFLPDLLTAQQQDPFLQQVAAGVEASDGGCWRDFSCNQQGFLCYQGAQDAMPRICVPSASRDSVLRAAHGNVLAGHPGVTRTAATVARFFWWPNLHRDVAHYVRTCRTCSAAKSSSGLRLGVDSFTSIPLQPFTHWSMDLIGPLPPSRSGNDLIVTWVDRTSKLIVARALKQGQSSAQHLAELTFEAICCRFGIPARLTHDNDVRFQSLWKELWRLLHTKISCTSSYNPQANPAERANRQVLEALRAAVASVTDFDQWDKALPHLCFGLNTQPSSVTQTSPFELAHGFPARVPLTLDLPAHARLTGDRQAADYALVVHNRLRAAADHAAAAQVRLGRLAAKRARPAEVKVGDWLYLDASPAHSPPHQVPYKLAGRWSGPYQALEVRGASVRLDLPAEFGKYSPWVNVRRLKFFEARDSAFLDDDAPATPVMGHDGALRYEIHRIWGHRPPDRLPAREYLVQWKGYDTAQMTWVKRATLLEDVPALLRAYEATPTTAQPRKSAPQRVAAPPRRRSLRRASA